MKTKFNRPAGSCCVCVLLLVSIIPEVQATETRVGSMGGIGLYIRDNSNVLYFPGTLIRYTDQAVMELRTKNNDDMYTLGGHASLNPHSTIGIYLNRPLALAISGDYVELERITELLYGMKSEGYDIGFKLGVGLDSYNRTYSDYELSESVRQFSLGGGLSNDQMDVGLMFDLPSLSVEEGNEETAFGGFGIGFSGRMFRGDENGLQLVPAGTFYYGTASGEYDSGITGQPTEKTDYGMLDLGLGVGVNRKLGRQNLIVAAIQLLNISSRTTDERGGSKTTDRTTTLPAFYLGAESAVKPWLLARLGASQLFQSYHQKTEPVQGTSTETNSRDAMFQVMFGLGIRIRGIEIDANLNEGLFFEGPNFLSGVREPMAYSLSLTYSFGGHERSKEVPQVHYPQPYLPSEPTPTPITPNTTEE